MFENLKEKLQEKIETNAVKSELTWKDKSGKEHTEIVLLKRSRLPIIGDWGRIYPPINENGNINWINFFLGGYRNLIKLILVLLVVGMVLWQFKEIFNYVTYLKSLPCVQSCIETIKQAPNLLG